MLKKKKKYLKEKQCRICGFRFIPRATTQVVCSPNCALALNKKKKEQEYDAETRRRKKAGKTRGDFAEDAQKAVNRFVRLRDAALPCISCGRSSNCQFHAGHYLTSGGHIELTYNTLNIHKQCAQCNNWKSANLIAYRANLVKKIGIEKVEWLEGPHELNKYTISDLKRIKAVFDRKYKILKAKTT